MVSVFIITQNENWRSRKNQHGRRRLMEGTPKDIKALEFLLLGVRQRSYIFFFNKRRENEMLKKKNGTKQKEKLK